MEGTVGGELFRWIKKGRTRKSQGKQMLHGEKNWENSSLPTDAGRALEDGL